MDPYSRDGSTGVPANLTSSQPAMSTIPAPVMPAAVPQTSLAADPLAIAAPAHASDGDVIEPEWVDAVERTLVATQADPFSVNAAIAALRKDYLHKRYGKEPGQAS